MQLCFQKRSKSDQKIMTNRSKIEGDKQTYFFSYCTSIFDQNMRTCRLNAPPRRTCPIAKRYSMYHLTSRSGAQHHLILTVLPRPGALRRSSRSTVAEPEPAPPGRDRHCSRQAQSSARCLGRRRLSCMALSSGAHSSSPWRAAPPWLPPPSRCRASPASVFGSASAAVQ